MELTLAIITKNRLKSLEECLASVLKQSCKEFKVLIIDNDRLKSALPIFKQFQSSGTFQMEYVCEPAPGYALARNCAIKNCRTKYVGFIDDDCILNPDWVENGLTAVKRYKSAFVVGLSNNSEASDIYTQVEHYITKNWWKDSYNTDAFEIKENRLDTKNVILDRSLLVKNKIYFDERFNRYGGEDCDLGIQLKQKGLIGYYVPEMVLLHNEISSFKRLRKKAFSYGYNCRNIYNKWNHIEEYRDWRYYNNYRFIKCWTVIFSLKQGSVSKNLKFFFLIKLFNFLYIRGLKKCIRDIKEMNRMRLSRNDGISQTGSD